MVYLSNNKLLPIRYLLKIERTILSFDIDNETIFWVTFLTICNQRILGKIISIYKF